MGVTCVHCHLSWSWLDHFLWSFFRFYCRNGRPMKRGRVDTFFFLLNKFRFFFTFIWLRQPLFLTPFFWDPSGIFTFLTLNDLRTHFWIDLDEFRTCCKYESLKQKRKKVTTSQSWTIFGPSKSPNLWILFLKYFFDDQNMTNFLWNFHDISQIYHRFHFCIKLIFSIKSQFLGINFGGL